VKGFSVDFLAAPATVSPAQSPARSPYGPRPRRPSTPATSPSSKTPPRFERSERPNLPSRPREFHPEPLTDPDACVFSLGIAGQLLRFPIGARSSFALPTRRMPLGRIRTSTELIPEDGQPPVLTSPNPISTLHKQSACARLSRPCLPGSSSRLFCNVHHHRF
jgi:hypothetical protein